MTNKITPPMPQFLMRFSNSKLFRNAHRLLFQASGRRLGGKINGMETLLLTTTGRKTGKLRTVPLLHLEDGDALVIVASNGGADHHPAWWHNLQSDPNVSVTSRVGSRPMRARPATPDETDRMWPRLTESNELLAYYPHITDRQLPLVYLEAAE